MKARRDLLTGGGVETMRDWDGGLLLSKAVVVSDRCGGVGNWGKWLIRHWLTWK